MNAIHDLCTTISEGDAMGRTTPAEPTSEATEGFWGALRKANEATYSSNPERNLRVPTDDDGVIGG